MKKKMMILSVALILISVSITSIITVQINRQNLLEEQEQVLLKYCELINDALLDAEKANAAMDYSQAIKTYARDIDQRITIVAADGTVLADSVAGQKYKTMENHKDREEIQEALESGTGVSIRDSATFGQSYIYVAAALNPDDQDSVITRIAMRIDELKLISAFLISTVVLSALIGAAIAIVIGYHFAGRITRPIREIVKFSEKIADGNYQERIQIRTGDELELLGTTINELAEKLDASAAETRRLENIRRDFVANVSHELKTPLTSISGFVETLQDGAAEDPALRDKFLGILSTESGRLRRLIEDLLIISDIENGREMNLDTDINVKEAIEETLAVLQPLIEKRKIQIQTSYAYEIIIGGNRDRFKQMMMNLIDNACKYSNEGGQVSVTVKKQDGKAVISVSDNGIGIEWENLPRLFERFYRVDKSRSIKSGGTGLGLSIVKHIVNLFHGEIKVESKPGEGTTFTVTLPT